jgi:Xaa-Pro aminopeptidase
VTRSPARRVRSRLCAVLVAGLVPNILCLRVNAQDIDQAAYRGRRERLAHLAKDGIVVVQTAPHLQAGLTESFIDDSDNHDFLYLTGIETPSGTVLLMPQSTDVPEVLFVPADQVERIRTETGVKTVMPQEALETVLSEAITDYSLKRMTERRHKLVSTEMARVLSLGQKKVFYFNYPRYVNVSGDPPARVRLASRVQLYSPDVELRNATPLLTSLRERHDKAELALMTRVVKMGADGLMAAMRACKPGTTDAQIDATAEYAFKQAGMSRLAYPSLVYISPFGRQVQTLSASEIAKSSEPMSAVHVMQSGDLVMLDAGGEYHHYSSDLSRMVPVSGKFTPEQRKLYDAVVAAHHAAVAAIRPGATFQQVHDAAVEELRKRGLDQYFTFGTSHFIGMDGHDPGNYEEPLAPGMVLTVEPGIIDNQRNITIHVEDMILVTEQGHENLSAAIPIEAPDIERFMAGTPTS